MSDTSAFGFGKFIPGFDFLQNLGKAGQEAAGMPSMSHWIAPTVSVEEIDKRIEELKAVQFWLEQNNRALSATVQALQVQKMTLSTLQGMNVNMTELAKAFPFAAAAGQGGAAAMAAAASGKKSGLSGWPLDGTQAAATVAPTAPEPTPAPSAAAQTPPPASEMPEVDTAASSAQAAALNTAMQWWSSLTQQFQQIAQQTLQDPAQQQAIAKATQMTSEFTKVAVQTAGDMVRQAVEKSVPPTAAPAAPKAAAQPAATSAAKKPASRSSAAQKAAPADKKASPVAAATKAAPVKKTATRKPAAR